MLFALYVQIDPDAMRTLKIAALFQLVAFSAIAQIPNSGMELWSNAPQLTDWNTNSYPMTEPPYEPYIVRQDVDAHSGSYAAFFYGNGFLKPWATTTFALGDVHPTGLAFWYKLMFAPCVNDEGFPEQDTVTISVELLLEGAVVDQGQWESTTTQMQYALQQIPISQNAAEFDSCRITITGGKVFGGCGIIAAATEFRVDHLALTFPTANCVDPSLIDPEMGCILVYDPVCGCNGITYSNSCDATYYGGVTSWTEGECDFATSVIGAPSASFSIYPNPVADRLRVNTAHMTPISMAVHSISGQLLIEQPFANELNITHLPAGIYLLEVHHADGVVRKRLVKE